MAALSPGAILEAMIMIPIFLAIDLLGFGLLFFGLDDFGILDIIGGGIFFLWLILRPGKEEAEIPSPKELKERKKTLQQTAKKAGKRLPRVLIRGGLVFFIELIPYLGGIVFGWTVMAIYELATS